MYQINIALRHGNMQLVLWFKTSSAMTDQLARTEEKWNDYLQTTSMESRESFTLRDDYGHIQKVDPANIASVFCSDVKAEGEGYEEKTMISYRAKKKLDERAQKDPILNGSLSATVGFRA